MVSGLRVACVAITALLGVATAANADCGGINFTVLKAGWVVGGSGGSGSVSFRGRTHRIAIGGISAGFVFGASETRFRGTVCNINSVRDVAGVYAAGGAGGAVGRGAQAIVLTNQKGAVLSLTGHQVGLQVNADVSGLAITLR
jgi:lipid-binding SYLF domain-containing protein